MNMHSHSNLILLTQPPTHASTNRRNKNQRKLLAMKENEIKVMASSWKLDPDDLVIQEELGRGTYGTVFKATMNKTWVVALKNCHNDRGGSKRLREYSKEVKFLMRTRHPRLVMFVGFGVQKYTDTIFVVTEYMGGGDLSKRLWGRKKDPPSWDQRVRWLTDITEGLMYLHYIHRSIHRDVKSGNILLTDCSNSARAKLGDFGLARVVSHGKIRFQIKKDTKELKNMSKADMNSLWKRRMTSSIGSPGWMAPELWNETCVYVFFLSFFSFLLFILIRLFYTNIHNNNKTHK